LWGSVSVCGLPYGVEELVVEECLVRERLVDEVPGVGVLGVQVADPREELAGLHGEALRQRERLEVGLLDLDAGLSVLAVQRDGGNAIELVVGVGGNIELGLGEREAVRPDARLAAEQEAGDVAVPRLAVDRRGPALQDQAERRIEGTRRGGGRSDGCPSGGGLHSRRPRLSDLHACGELRDARLGFAPQRRELRPQLGHLLVVARGVGGARGMSSQQRQCEQEP